MSGFDTSQPITDETALEDVDASGQAAKTQVTTGDDPDSPEPAAKPSVADEPAEADELGDGTPGPR